uniref:guanylate cyclase n=1 Tax=Macrostomum lignano TaxID=282301 RepID=A0A1I8IZT5_9PLAT
MYEMFGSHFFKYFKKHGYDKMIYTLGQDLKKFIQNLDSLHDYLQIDNKSMVPPSFSCNYEDSGEFILHYYSARAGLESWIKGMLTTVAKEIFSTEIQLKVMDIDTDFPPESRYQTHVRILISFASHSSLAASLDDFVQPCYPSKSLITVKSFVRYFPYHIIFDSLLFIKQSGAAIQSVCQTLRFKDSVVKLTEVCELVNPPVNFSSHYIKRFLNSSFTLRLKRSIEDDCTESSLLIKGKGWGGRCVSRESSLLINGQMIFMEDTNLFLFVCSPRVMTLSEMMEKNIFMSDLPLYDVTRELLQVNQQRLAEIEISKHMDEMTNEMKKMTAELEDEKKKTHTLLSQMLPSKVAKQLLEGKRVAAGERTRDIPSVSPFCWTAASGGAILTSAEKYEICTILFSDIVTFTDIASQCTPMNIVDMLNNLYSLFDKATEVNKVYKVETIGDAYMVVGGVPERTDQHAHFVSEQAMDMIEASCRVASPVTNLPLQIRVGMHTGPTVAGVVGDKMPRFCLFGDTVNVASRMESHGVPSRIHVSPTTYKVLTEKCADKGYKFEGRGEINIKGKGLMSTYFLLGHAKRTLKAAPRTPSLAKRSASAAASSGAVKVANGAAPSEGRHRLSDPVFEKDETGTPPPESADPGHRQQAGAANGLQFRKAPQTATCRLL